LVLDAGVVLVEVARETAAAEQRFPVAIFGLHGVLAATTLVLVFLAAAGIG
jgi:hypothetical protein